LARWRFKIRVLLGIGTRDLLLFAFVVFMFVGSARIPKPAALSPRSALPPSSDRWTTSDWMVLAAAVLLGVSAAGLAFSAR
jgi:hypothetical protein